MAYSDVQTLVANVLNRTDLTTQIKVWINDAMREAERGAIMIDGRVRVINWNHMRKRQTTSSAETYITMPSTIKSIEFLKIEEDDIFYDLDKYDLATALSLYPVEDDVTGRPIIYALCDATSEILVRPYPDTTYTYDMGFYQFTADMSADADYNYFTLYAEDILVYGALVQSAVYIGHDERLAIWEKLYEQKLTKLALSQKEYDASDRKMVIRSNMPSQMIGGGRFDIDVIQ